MNDIASIYQKVYKQHKLFNIDKIGSNPFGQSGMRPNTVAVAGGMLGDEGKGRVTDDLTARFLRSHRSVLHYRDNGGANAGHTVQVDKVKIALHQLSAGVLQEGCQVVLGKGMVIHPEDLELEIDEVLHATHSKQLPATLKIDELAVLSLDTHRAWESALKQATTGGSGSTGRGIAPAYADVVYRIPLRMRDLAAKDWKARCTDHYRLYGKMLRGFGHDLADQQVPRLDGSTLTVGTETQFLARLGEARDRLLPYIQSLRSYLLEAWQSDMPMVFEKAQAIGLDARWGVYPDVTASDCTFAGIASSTEGVVDVHQIGVRVGVIKATYSSSVGSRELPTLVKTKLADRIREDAHEYGATTKRPRDIAYIDLPMMRYLFQVGQVNYLVPTHVDISYTDQPIKVCVAYEQNGRSVPYRPDQTYLDLVKPRYVELPPWDGSKLHQARNISDLPMAALQYLAFMTQALSAELLMITTGPERSQSIHWYR